MNVAVATPADAEVVAQIASSVHVDRFGKEGRGFLVLPRTAQEYAQRLASGYSGWIAEVDGTAAGFVYGVASQVVAPANPVQRFAAEYFGDRRYFVLEQLAVLPDYQDRGCGRRLLEMVTGPIVIDVVEKPIENPRLAWWKRRGFVRIGEVSAALPAGRTIEGRTDVTWGIYVRE